MGQPLATVPREATESAISSSGVQICPLTSELGVAAATEEEEESETGL